MIEIWMGENTTKDPISDGASLRGIMESEEVIGYWPKNVESAARHSNSQDRDVEEMNLRL